MAAVQVEDVVTKPKADATADAPPAPREGPSWRISPALRQEIMAALEQPPRMTYEEFLAWADEDTLAEWVNGEVIMSSPASDRHQDLTRFLTAILSAFVETHNLGIVRPAPFQMKLEHGREPDLLFLAREHLDRLRRNYLDGPADLVIEIVSPESAGRDRGEKFYEYAQGGVPEYWLIDSDARWAEFYRLGERRYRLAFEGREGEYHAAVLPGFWLRVEWLWQEPLPAVDAILLEIGGVEYARRQIALIRERGLWPAEDEG
ncbi:MAG: Uma2 family endonuclease [Anaerolineae bacterium]